MMGDDGEKFGAWPTTWEHCWGERRWVERFFEALEANADWLTTTTPSAWLAEHPPIGRVYVPTGSYAEMGEWALPPDESLVFTDVLHRARAEHRPEARWLRGAFWRNFQVKYREINDLHKRMLRVSNAVAGMPDGPTKERALDNLYQGQSNDCYWHGLFGGIYISHMRLATHEHIIAAEDLAENATGSLHHAETNDLDMDGVDEVLLADDGQVVTVDLDGGAGIGAWDIRSVRHAMAAVMRRRPEAYHATLLALERSVAAGGGASVGGDGEGGGGGGSAPASIHDTVRVKEPGLASRLVYDAYERRSGLVRALGLDATAEDWSMARATELGDAVDGAFEVVELGPGNLVTRRAADMAGADVGVTKTLTLGGNRRAPTLTLRLDLEHRDGPSLDARIGIEWALTMLGGGGNPAAWWDVRGVRSAHDAAGTAEDLSTIAQGNDYIGVSVTTTTSPADAWWAPIETVSNSEAGFERVYQGGALLLSWPVRLAAGERWTRTISHVVATTHDRATEER
jgi:alpha-amylase